MAHNKRSGILSATTLVGDPVKNSAGEDLGELEDLMIDLDTGRISYAVISFGGFLGMGDKLFALPWSSLRVDLEDKSIRVDIDKERLENAPGFDNDNWPGTNDYEIEQQVYDYYEVDNPYTVDNPADNRTDTPYT